MKGTGRIYKRGNTWWVDYSFRGKRYRESTGSDLKKNAQKLLRKRMGEMGTGKFIGPDDEKVTVPQLLDLIRTDYKINQRKSARRLEVALKHIDRHFGHLRATDITTSRVKTYIADRQDEGAANSTIRNEVNALRRSLNLALEDGVITKVEKIPAPEVHNVRKGFFTEGDLQAVMAELPDDLKPVVRFAALTGWRKAEILSLRWSQVDLDAGEIRLEPGTTKNDEGREIPYWELPELAELIEEQRTHTDQVERDRHIIVTHVFHRNGEPILCIRGAWDAACETTGLNGHWFHDLRRTAVRQMERAGVPRTIAMLITGHRTEAVYRRYAITDKESTAEGMKKIHEFRQQQAEDRTVVPIRREA